jgi:4-amino-4-deoxy-L-arabinose transferase-like glycosyltransferase
LTTISKRWAFAAWLVLIGAFAFLHVLNLRADFPNHSPWYLDWAKYTDEGWYSNAAIRAHLFGDWYVPGDFNPAPAVPVWPFLEWILFFFTGVNVEAARGLAVAFFFTNLLLTYMLIRSSKSRWTALLALTLTVTSPFLYCFSRLAILEPMLTTLMLSALNIAVRLPRLRRPIVASIAIGLLFTLMMLTKTTAVFLLPAIGWAMLLAFWDNRMRAVRCAIAAMAAFVGTFCLWMGIVFYLHLRADYKYLFFINTYTKPTEVYWPILSFWWSLRGSMWVDHILVPLSALLLACVVVVATTAGNRNTWARRLLKDPVFGSALVAAMGYIFFMTYQNHPQPRYFAVVAVFCFIAVAVATEAFLTQPGPARNLGRGALAVVALAAVINGVWTLNYATHPEYTFVTAAEQLAAYIDQHPNGNRLLVSISGDQISLVTHMPTLCDDFGTPSAAYPDLSSKLAHYQPGWWATWNDIDPGTLEDIHTHFSLEQVASFRAFDDPERNELVLFKLHPLPDGKVRHYEKQNLAVVLPDDKINIPIE